MNIKKLIREEIDAFGWTEDIEPSNIQTLRHILDNSDYEIHVDNRKQNLNRAVILYYGTPLTMFHLGSDIDSWLKRMENGMDNMVGSKWEDAYHELYELLKEHYDILSR